MRVYYNKNQKKCTWHISWVVAKKYLAGLWGAYPATRKDVMILLWPDLSPLQKQEAAERCVFEYLLTRFAEYFRAKSSVFFLPERIGPCS
jgi:hypothetical protein